MLRECRPLTSFARGGVGQGFMNIQFASHTPSGSGKPCRVKWSNHTTLSNGPSILRTGSTSIVLVAADLSPSLAISLVAFVKRAWTRTCAHAGRPCPRPRLRPRPRPRLRTRPRSRSCSRSCSRVTRPAGRPEAKHSPFQWNCSLKISCSCRISLVINGGIGEC